MGQFLLLILCFISFPFRQGPLNLEEISFLHQELKLHSYVTGDERLDEAIAAFRRAHPAPPPSIPIFGAAKIVTQSAVVHTQGYYISNYSLLNLPYS